MPVSETISPSTRAGLSKTRRISVAFSVASAFCKIVGGRFIVSGLSPSRTASTLSGTGSPVLGTGGMIPVSSQTSVMGVAVVGIPTTADGVVARTHTVPASSQSNTSIASISLEVQAGFVSLPADGIQ